ncbi:MAG: glutamine--fructose-6-phosphate transaminase (isomerizing) [Nanoarchaeota archaeon]|nr:glutamine--fructose-6-phosphate transaminase (isomerizing) [Nanoarchaeota archaeon]
MCGIVGAIAERNIAPVLLESLKKLEYRGYDSAGLATIENKTIVIKKECGKIDEVDQKVNLKDQKGNIGLAHTRWSTCGSVTKENAHPHQDCTKNIAIVHNGIIENHSELRAQLTHKGHTFTSDTDTEVIAHLIEENNQGNIVQAIAKTLKQLEGSYALGIIEADNPHQLIAARKESPLIIGLGEKENFIASDAPAILKQTNKVIYLDNEEIAVLTIDEVEIFDLDGNKKEKEIETIEWDSEKAGKQAYEHFMLKEIHEQSSTIAKTLEQNIEDNIDLKEVKRIIIVACGTSWHAGLVGEFMIEELAKIPVEVEYASEFRYRDPIIEENTLIVPISQSGETADTLAALKEARTKGAKILSIVNVKGSSIERESDAVLYTKAGPEIGVASTKAFTAQLTVLYLLTLHLGKLKNTLPKDQIANRVRDLRKIPLQIEQAIEETQHIKKLAKLFYKKHHALYLGRGINYPIALEGALKLKEVSYIHAEGYPAAEMKHGPIALIDEQMPVIAIATKDDRTYKKVISNIEEVTARGGVVIAIATKGDEEIAKKVDHVIYIPENSYILTPLLATIPLQLFAYYIATLRNHDPDKPKNLAKSVTVE